MTEKSRSNSARSDTEINSSAIDKSGRIPPQDLNAEKSLLGAILLDDSSFPEILEIVKPQDFYDQKHAKIFFGMSSLYE